MPVATLTNIEKTFGKRVLFDKLSLNVYRGERIGLIGANGSGKTSLFKVFIKEIVPDAGQASVSDEAKLGYLSQDPVFDPENTVIDEAELAFGALHELAHRMRDLEHAMGEHVDEQLEKTLKKYETLQHEFDLAGGYVWHHKLEATLLGVGLERNTWEQKVSTLSGGQRSRLALAKLLISDPDLLLLDEPTNHLDLAAIEWLENYLLDFKGAVVLISHDRFLLDRLATRIAWLHQQKISTYKGNYTAFIAQRELQELTQQRQFEEQQADIEKQKEFIRRFGAGQRSKEAKGREKRLNRLLVSDAMINQVETQKKIRLSISTDQRAGDKVLTVRELSKSYDDRALWDNIKFDVKRGERIGVIGPNGSGKTTLLEVLLGRRDADGGEVKWGANLNIGYYDQRLDQFDPDSTVLDETWGDRAAKEQEVRDVLATMLFRGEDIHKPVGLLSGGERARVRLAQLLLDKPNVLVLDEPTNHLDIASCEALENTLRDFEGTLLCVSHDRYFLDKTAQRLLVLDPPGVIDFTGNYSAWAHKQSPPVKADESPVKKKQSAQASAQSRPAAQARSSASARPADRKRENAYARPFGRLSMEELEQQIADTELALSECQEMFATADSFKEPARGQKLQAEYDAIATKLQQLEAEYYERET
jgi:ATP-binding cassette subfamily F protein 3